MDDNDEAYRKPALPLDYNAPLFISLFDHPPVGDEKGQAWPGGDKVKSYGIFFSNKQRRTRPCVAAITGHDVIPDSLPLLPPIPPYSSFDRPPWGT
ncbi:MAG: hypothetical protein JW913_12060 [Chitinispirillaceae bacterium]|nr:hypothetical protein [Chitinispirillaceae bacterium]